MPPITFPCPHCGCILKSNAPIAPGKRVKCPKCATLFEPTKEVPEEAAVPDVSEGGAARERPRRDEGDDVEEAPRRRRSRRDEEDDQDDYEEDRPRPRRKRRPKQTAGTALVLWLSLGGVGLLVLIGGVILLIVWLSRPDPLVGWWNLERGQDTGIVNFREDGKVEWTINGRTHTGTYRHQRDLLHLKLSDTKFPNAPPSQSSFQILSLTPTELFIEETRLKAEGRMFFRKVKSD